MPANPKYRINLTDREIDILTRLMNRHTTPQHIARRAKIIFLANHEYISNHMIAIRLEIHPNEVTLWTKRWIENGLIPVIERLSDRPRAGRPDTITPEQWCQIIAIACENPEDHGIPITHWSSPELANRVCELGVVENLSAGYLRKFLKSIDLQPHRNRYWLNAKADEKKRSELLTSANYTGNAKNDQMNSFTA